MTEDVRELAEEAIREMQRASGSGILVPSLVAVAVLSAVEPVIRRNEREQQAKRIESCAINADQQSRRPGVDPDIRQHYIAEKRAYNWAVRLLREDDPAAIARSYAQHTEEKP